MPASHLVLIDDIIGVQDAMGDVLKEFGVCDDALQVRLARIIAAGVMASRHDPLDTFSTYHHGSEAVQNAIFRINALVSHVKD